MSAKTSHRGQASHPHHVAACLVGLLTTLILCMSVTSCAYWNPTPSPTPNYAALETKVARALGATQTAKAPTATATPSPTLTQKPTTAPPTTTPSPTPSPLPTPVSQDALLAYVRTTLGEATNLVIYNATLAEELILTHFVEPRNMSDLTWSRDGAWLLFVSAHDYMYSRSNERNVFAIRPDGTDLHMITGEYADPANAPGPFVTLSGNVEGGTGTCLVCAQGTLNIVATDEDRRFELTGVPVSAKWIRSVCLDSETTWQGDIDISLESDQDPESVVIPVSPQGRGWRQAALSCDDAFVAGTYYRWELSPEGQEQLQFEGRLYSVDGEWLGDLELPEDTRLIGVDWSPLANELVGALTAEDSVFLWQWNAQGASLGPLVEIPNPEQAILTISNPVWSPNGSRIAFGLRYWDWWGENKYKTELMVLSQDGQELQRVVETDWGEDAADPTWSADSSALYYRYSVGDPADASEIKPDGTLYMVTIGEEPQELPLVPPLISYLPAAYPKSQGALVAPVPSGTPTAE